MRAASLICATVPFVVVFILMTIAFQTYGWDGLGLLLLTLASIPFLLVLSITSVVLAFRKTSNLHLDKTAKIVSIISVSAFGLGTIGIGVMLLMTQAAYAGFAQ